MTKAQFTPGPWGWFGNGSAEEVYLATTNNGRIFVMQFKEPPMFQKDNVMVSALSLAKFEVGNQHVTGISQARKDKSVYRYSINDIDHPDAHLIKAAPKMYEALETLIEAMGDPDIRLREQCKKNALDALAEARGES